MRSIRDLVRAERQQRQTDAILTGGQEVASMSPTELADPPLTRPGGNYRPVPLLQVRRCYVETPADSGTLLLRSRAGDPRTEDSGFLSCCDKG